MVKMVLGSSDTQASSVATLADNYRQGFESIVSAIDTLKGSDKLKGSAYENVKSYGDTVVTPLAKGMVLLAEAAKTDTQMLPDKWRSDVGEDELSDDTEVLQAEIDALDATIATNNSLLDGMKSNDPNKSTTEKAVRDDTAERDKRQKKLDKINAYDAASSGFFSDIAGLEADVSSGLTLLNQGIAGFNGSFTMPSKGQLKWAKNINKEFKQYQNYQSAVSKAQKGEALTEEEAKAVEAYKKKHPGVEIDKSVTKAVDESNETQRIKSKAEEDYKNGLIDKKTLDQINSALISFGAQALADWAKSKATNAAVEGLTRSALQWLSNTTNAMQLNTAGELIGGGVSSLGIDFNPMYANFIRGGLRYGIPIVGGLVDFGMQKARGEDTGDALLKTGGHIAAGQAGLAVGAAVGGPLGAVVGFGVSYLGSMAVDYVVDHKEEIVDGAANVVKGTGKAIGDAVSGFGNALGSVFG